MSTTTIRLPEDLKARLASAAQHAGVSSHNFILQAIAEKTEQEEQRAKLDALADHRYAQILATGQTIAWEEMRNYLMESASGKEVARPQAQEMLSVAHIEPAPRFEQTSTGSLTSLRVMQLPTSPRASGNHPGHRDPARQPADRPARGRRQKRPGHWSPHPWLYSLVPPCAGVRHGVRAGTEESEGGGVCGVK